MYIDDESLYSAENWSSAPTSAPSNGGGLIDSVTKGLDPFGALFGAIGSTVGAVASAPPAGPSSAVGGTQGGAKFDNSGWNVTFGSGGIDSRRDETAPANIGQATAGLMQYAPHIALAVVAVLVIKKLKKRG